MLFQSLQWIRHRFHALMAAQDRYIQIHTFLYLLCIRLYPLQRMHILNQYTYMIHTDTYRYIQYIRYELIYLTCILPVFLYVSCMYLVYICMYCMYLSVFSAAKIVSRIDTYNTYIYIHICTRYIQICIPIHTKYIQNTCTYIQSLPELPASFIHVVRWCSRSGDSNPIFIPDGEQRGVVWGEPAPPVLARRVGCPWTGLGREAVAVVACREGLETTKVAGAIRAYIEGLIGSAKSSPRCRPGSQ